MPNRHVQCTHGCLLSHRSSGVVEFMISPTASHTFISEPFTRCVGVAAVGTNNRANNNANRWRARA